MCGPLGKKKKRVHVVPTYSMYIPDNNDNDNDNNNDSPHLQLLSLGYFFFFFVLGGGGRIQRSEERRVGKEC